MKKKEFIKTLDRIKKGIIKISKKKATEEGKRAFVELAEEAELLKMDINSNKVYSVGELIFNLKSLRATKKACKSLKVFLLPSCPSL